MNTEEQKQKRREWERGYREANREKLREAKRRRYAANPEKYRAEAREFATSKFEANPEAVRAKRKDQVAKQRAKNPEKFVAETSRRVREHRLRQFGLTMPDLEKMLEAQAGLCWICGSILVIGSKGKTRCCVDHDHETGKVRGLLCAVCNLGIGYLGDSPERMVRASEYLARELSAKESWAGRGKLSPPARTEEERKARLRTNTRKFLYGLTDQEFERMLEQQAGLCWVCGCLLEISVTPRRGNKRVCVDHDHQTNQVRGLLCNNCNAGMGSMKESPALLVRASEYIARFTGWLEGVIA